MTELSADFQEYLQHARVQQRLSPRTLRIYTDGLERRFALASRLL